MRRPSRILSGALAGFMASFWCILPATSYAQAGQAEVAREFERSLLAIEDGVRDMSRDTFDPQYVVDQVGVEPQKLFDWVKSNVAWVPYEGSLRGPRGAMMDRMGNSLDRALLLAELLRLAGSEVRLAHAKLSPDQVEKVWGELRGVQDAWKAMLAQAADEEYKAALAAAAAANAPVDPAATPTDAVASAEQLAQAAQTPEDMVAAAQNIDPISIIQGYGLDLEGTTSVLDEAANDTAQLQADLETRTLVHWGRLMDMGVVPNTKDVDERIASAKAMMADHWWVEVNSGGTWTAADTLSPSLAYGQALAQASEAIDAAQLPLASNHTVTLKLVSEQWKDGKVVETTMLKHDMIASQMIGQRISVKQLPTHWPEDWPTVTPEVFQRQLKAAAVTQSEWVPLITIGEQQFIESSVRDNGTTNPNPDMNTAFGALGVPTGGGVARVGDLFDTPAPEGEESVPEAGDPARAEGELTAMWIDYEIKVPGKEPRIVRRELFDLIGTAARAMGIPAALTLTTADREKRSVSMLAETEILIQPCEFSADFMLQLSSQAALANKPFLERMGASKDPFGAAPADLTETMLKMVPGPGVLHHLAGARFTFSPVNESVFIAEPNVLANHVEMVPDANGDFYGRKAIDIVNNTVEVSINADSAPGIRLVQGVVDSNAEIMVMADSPHLYGAAELFEHTGLDTGGWASLKKGEESKLLALALPPEVIARIIADLEAGYTVVAPSGKGLTKVTAGWWRIDPKTGNTLGMGANGWGTSLVEYAFVLVIKTMLAQMVCMAQAGLKASYDAAVAKGPSGSKGIINKVKEVGQDIKNSQDSFKKGASAAFKFCMVTALFGGFMSFVQTPLIGQKSIFPPEGPKGRLPGEGFYIPPGTRIGPKGMPPIPPPRVTPPPQPNRGGPGPSTSNTPPGKLPPMNPPPVRPGNNSPPNSNNPPKPPTTPPRPSPPPQPSPPTPRPPNTRPTLDEVKNALQDSRNAWDAYTNATRNSNTPPAELNRLYDAAVKAEQNANQMGFKDYVGKDFDAGAHARMKDWANAQDAAYKGMQQPANTKVTPPGQDGKVDPGAITEVNRGIESGPITAPQQPVGPNGTSTGIPTGTPGSRSLAGPNSSGNAPPSSQDNGPATLDAEGYPGYPFAGPGAHSGPLPSYTPGYQRPPPPPSAPPGPLPSRGPGDINGPQSVQDGGHYTGYPFASPPSAPAEVGLGSLANGMSKLAL